MRLQTEGCVVLLNGPSRKPFTDYAFSVPVIGCNYLCRDRQLDHCVVLDRLCIKSIVELGYPAGQFWTKARPLDLPPGWRQREFPGVDSGTSAILLGLELYGSAHVIGADGILQGDSSTLYHYKWHPRGPRPGRHSRFRKTARELQKTWGDLLTWEWREKDPDLRVINKYSHGQTGNNI